MSATTRERVLRSADELIADRGYDRFSIADLVAASGVSSGSIYHHFGAKDGVLAALLLAAVEDYQECVLGVLDTYSQDARGGVLAVVATHLDWMGEHQREAALLLAHRDAVTSGSRREQLRALNSRFLCCTSEWLRVQADSGQIPPVPVEVAHAIVFAPAQEVSRLWLSGRIKARPPTFATALGEAAWAGMLAVTPQEETAR